MSLRMYDLGDMQVYIYTGWDKAGRETYKAQAEGPFGPVWCKYTIYVEGDPDGTWKNFWIEDIKVVCTKTHV